MSGWIKFEKDLADDPRVREMAHQLMAKNVTVASLQTRTVTAFILGGLAKLWFYADTHIGDGDDTLAVGPDDINEIVGIDDFAQILPPNWLQIIDAKHVKFPNFHRHNGTTAKERAVTAKRVQRHRSTVTDDPLQATSTVKRSNRYQTKTKTKTLKTPSSLPSPDPDIQHSNPTAVAPTERANEGVLEVFAHWQTEHAKQRSSLDATRRRVIIRALAAYDAVTLKEAISGYKLSPHHMGQNPSGTVYDDIEVFLRDSKHIEAGLSFARRPPQPMANAVELARQRLRDTINGSNGHGRLVEQDGDAEGEGGSRVGTTPRLLR